MKIPLDSLRKLPEGAEYRAKSGRASAMVKTRGDTLLVHAECDSLQRWCEYYEREAGFYREAYNEAQRLLEETQEKRSHPFKAGIIAFFAGVATGIILTLLFKRLWQKNLCTA